MGAMAQLEGMSNSQMAVLGHQLRPSLGDDADFLVYEGEAAAALGRQRAEQGISESSRESLNNNQQQILDENEAQLQALFLNQQQLDDL